MSSPWPHASNWGAAARLEDGATAPAATTDCLELDDGEKLARSDGHCLGNNVEGMVHSDAEIMANNGCII